jgi:hypothetical protein
VHKIHKWRVEKKRMRLEISQKRCVIFFVMVVERPHTSMEQTYTIICCHEASR